MEEKYRQKLIRIALGLLVAIFATGFCFSIFWALWSAPFRIPTFGEHEILFEASRLRQGLPLYTDPVRGTFDYGPVPSRYYVTYTPLWSCVLAAFPPAHAMLVGRFVAVAIWLGVFVAIALSAPRELRLQARVASLSVAGLFVLVLFAATSRPDTPALAISVALLLRVLKKKRLDFISAGLIAIAPFLKPTIFAIGGGILLFDLRARGLGTRSRAAWKPALGAVATFAAALIGIAAILQMVSGGVWLQHLIASNLQPFRMDHWIDSLTTRAPFFFPPIALAAWAAASQLRKSPELGYALFALFASTLWTIVSLAKIGSSTNYWFEPCAAAAVILAKAPLPKAISKRRLAAFAFAIAYAIYVNVANVHASVERFTTDPQDAGFVAMAEKECHASNDSVVMADHAGVELLANQRIVITTYQMAFLALAGRFPKSVWIDDLNRPEVRCYIESTGMLRFVPEVWRTVEEKFAIAKDDGRSRLWIKR